MPTRGKSENFLGEVELYAWVDGEDIIQEWKKLKLKVEE